MGNSHNKLIKKLSSPNEEEILEGIKQLKKTLDATSTSAYNDFLAQCLQLIGRVLAAEPNRFSKGFLISFIKHIAFLPELPVVSVDARIKSELFEHVMSKLVLAVYTHDVEISLKSLALLQHLFTEQQGQRARAFPEWKPFMNALIAYKMTNMNQTRDHVRALVDAAAALVPDPHFSTVVALFSEILVHEPDPTCQGYVLQLIVNLFPKFVAMPASVLTKLLQTLIGTIDQHGEENSAHVTSVAYQCLQLFVAQHAALVDWTALLVHVIGQQIFAAKSRDWEVLNLALLSTAVEHAPLEDTNVRHVLQSLSYFRKKFQRHIDTFEFPNNDAELMRSVLQILTRVINRAPPPVTWGSRGYYVALVLVTLPFFAARNDLVDLSCEIINHIEGLEPQKHVLATHLLFLAKYLHPHTILAKLRLPNEFPEPTAVQMSKIIPLDLALGAPRPALNLFHFFTEFDHVSVSNNDFQAELQTRVKSSVASLTTLLTRGLRCHVLDSGSFSYLLTFLAAQLPLESALLTRVWCQVLVAVSCHLAHAKDQFMNRASVSIHQEREATTAEVRNLRARLEEKLRDNEALTAKIATLQGHVDTAQRERDTLAQSLTCPICYEDFTKKGAVSIDCGHILCAACQQLISAGPVTQRLCPICRHVITSPRPLKGLG